MKKLISSIIISIVAFNTAVAQIPNNSFENWVTMSGYSNPVGWDNLNQITYSQGIFTCVKLSPGNPGASYLSLITKNVPSKGIVPGRVVSGKIDTVTYKPLSGYPFVLRPQTLSYSMQYMPYDPSDSVYVSVLLTKWNTSLIRRDTIAYGASYYNAMAHAWFTGSTYLNYMSGDAPDSAMIVISSSSKNPKQGSFIYADNLQFNGSVIGITENNYLENNVFVYPNPSADVVHINSNDKIKSAKVELINLLGETLFTDVLNTQMNIPVFIYQPGVYILRITENNNVLNKKIIIK